VLVTSPQKYAARLCGRLIDAGMRPLWTPGVATSPFAPGSRDADALDAAVAPLLVQPRSSAPPPPAPPAYDYVAFTSRAGVEALMASIMRLLQQKQQTAAATPAAAGEALRSSGALVCALGVDGDLLKETYGVECDVNPYEDASTMGLVRALKRRLDLEEEEQARSRRPRRPRRPRNPPRPRVLCPVPRVLHGLVEPPVVPRFLSALEEIGVEPVRVDAYATVPGLWAPPAEGAEDGREARRRAAGLAAAAERVALENGDVAAVVFSSTAEAQGLVLQFYWAAGCDDDDDDDGEAKEEEEQIRLAASSLLRLLQRANERRAALNLPPVLLAAHGPTTAAGVAEVLGLAQSDILVSKDWSSFAGVTEALAGALLLPARR
jgi:uroporphyrinogen-III synthase